tara:strand:- start:5869 stop:6750 length:882 start_codon:yes stop_codon:yes gene_type:complete
MQHQFNSQSTKGDKNTGSSSNLTNYLDKEVENNWFNGEQQGIKTDQVKIEIDSNAKGGVKKTDIKFYEVQYMPSHKEQQQIIKHATGKKDISDWRQLSPGEQEKVKASFAEYVREAQNIQARNFNKEGIESGKDLKYFAKIETQRKFKGTDEAVKQGRAKQGDLKPGLQMHAHVIQSRKTADKKRMISPMANARKVSAKNPVKAGFDRQAFTNNIEQAFDKKYNHTREIKETYEWQKANKFNRLDRKIELENQGQKSFLEKRNAYLQDSPGKTPSLVEKSKEKEQNRDRGLSR